MAQTGFTPISIYYSTTASATPTAGNLVAGELAINTADGKLFYKDSSGVVQTLATKNAAAGSFTSITDSGNLTFTGTGNRITGDFSNTTVTNRVAFQTSTANSNTAVALIPNGTATASNIAVMNNSDPTNASLTRIRTDATISYLEAAINGTGTYLPLTMSTGGSERLRIDTSGNVGIGTNNPQAKEHIAVSTSAVTETLRLDNAGNFADNGNKISWYNAGQTTEAANISAFRISSGTGFGLSFATSSNFTTTNAVERMRIDSSGNVGIGVTNPVVSLEVNGTIRSADGTAAAPSMQPGVDADTGFFRPLANNIGFSTAGTERMRIDSSGNVGVGTASPNFGGNSVALGVNGTSSSALNLLVNGTGAFTASSGSGYTAIADGRASTSMQFSLGGSERMRIDSSGNVIVGTTSQTFSGTRLQVNGGGVAISNLGSGNNPMGQITAFNNDATSGGLVFQTLSSSTLSERMRIDSSGNLLVGTTSVTGNTQGFTVNINAGTTYTNIGHVTGSASGSSYEIFNYNGTAIGSISQNGTTAVAYNTSSDYRLKENITPMTGALAKVAQLKPVTYKWKADGSDGQGFIAHELAEVCPDAVTGEKDAVDEDGNPKYQGIDVSFLVATLTAAIKEQQVMIEELKAKVAALEAA